MLRASFSTFIRDVALTHPDLADMKLALRANCTACSAPFSRLQNQTTSKYGADLT